MEFNVESASIKNLGIIYKDTKSEKIYNRLYKRVKPGLINYIYKIVNDVDDTNQVFNETMCKVYTHIDMYDPNWNISTWIYRIAYTHACGLLRAKNSSKTTPMSYFENSAEMDLTSKIEFHSLDEYKDNMILSEDIIQISKQNSDLVDLLETLPIEYKDVLKRKFWDDKKYEDIATEYSIPLQTVKNRIFRGKNMLSAKYVKLYGIPLI